MRALYFPIDTTRYDVVSQKEGRVKTVPYFINAIEYIIDMFEKTGQECMVTHHNGSLVLAEIVQGFVKVHAESRR